MIKRLLFFGERGGSRLPVWFALTFLLVCSGVLGQTAKIPSTNIANGLTTAVASGPSPSSFVMVPGKINNAVRFIPHDKYAGASASSSSVSGAGSGPVTLEMWLNTLNPSTLDGGNIGQKIGIPIVTNR